MTRAAAILRLLGRSDTPLGVSAIARRLGLIPSTCLHILRALADEELVAFDPDTKRYRLGPATLALARHALRQNSFSRLVQPGLDRLAQGCGLTAIGIEVIGLDHMIVTAISHSEIGVRLHVDLGSRFPALISATGRCLAAFGGHPWEELERRFRALRWHRAPTFESWRCEVEDARRKGYSVDEGNYIEGVTILGVPVLNDDGRMTHGLVAIGVIEQMRRLGAGSIAAELRTVAERLSGLAAGRP